MSRPRVAVVGASPGRVHPDALRDAGQLGRWCSPDGGKATLEHRRGRGVSAPGARPTGGTAQGLDAEAPGHRHGRQVRLDQLAVEHLMGASG